jgi:lysozyme
MMNTPKRRLANKPDCGCPHVGDDNSFEASAWAVGIDVSHHNGDVNWLTVRKAGYSFAFLKASEGETYTDATYATNRNRAAAAGLYVGAYHFYRPKTSSAINQARHFVSVIGQLRNNELPPVLDIEDEKQWKGISSADAIKMVKTFCTEVQSALGVRPIIYVGLGFVTEVLANDPSLRDFALWLARYTTSQSTEVPAPWTRWTFWQHSEHGQVPGVSTECDMNRFNGTEDELSRLVRHAAVSTPLTTEAYYAWLRVLMWFGF